MAPTRLTRYTLVFAWLLLATCAIPLGAQPARESQPARGFFASAYNAAHEITLNGTVQEVITKHTLGSPAGMHLLVAGPQGITDAHVGPFLSKDTQAALHAGVPVQIVGAMQPMHGKQYLLVRQLTVGGRMVTVRSSRGFLTHAEAQRGISSRTAKRTAKSEARGGNR